MSIAQATICSADVISRDRDALRREAFADNENNSKGALHHPMLKIEHAQAGEGHQTQEGEQLITPLHERDVEGPPIIVKLAGA